jgi:hypothetical protein
MADPYEERAGRAAFWATVVQANPPEFAADDPTRQAAPDVGAYSIKTPIPSSGFTTTAFGAAERL